MEQSTEYLSIILKQRCSNFCLQKAQRASDASDSSDEIPGHPK